LKQFPSPQRRMFPMSLRKDHWIPLVHAIFPTHLIANHIYKRLLDYRAWRLTSPPSPSQLLLTRKRRNQLALNQVPTSIADLAHVTNDIPGRMIMNWDRFEEHGWAKEWNENIWHCNKGFSLKRGYKLTEYQFPKIDDEVREIMGWEGSDEMEPPTDLKEAVEQHKSIWEKMHAKWLQKRKGRPSLSKKAKSRKQQQIKEIHS
jgi:Transcriptional regulation of mitochondrial recombination